MGLNRLYFDHQISLIRAQEALTPHLRSGYCNAAALIAGQIRSRQTKLGASAARSWGNTEAWRA